MSKKIWGKKSKPALTVFDTILKNMALLVIICQIINPFLKMTNLVDQLNYIQNATLDKTRNWL